MNNQPRQTLRRIIGKYGREISSDRKRCEGLLNDLCGSHRREINVLVNAMEERIPLDLLAANRSMPLEVLLKRLANRLEEHTAMTREAASWAVDSWALALDLATDAEIEALEERARSAAISDAATAAPKPVQTPKPPAYAAPPRPNPPVVRQPTGRQSPPQTFPATHNPPVFQPQTVNPPVIAARRFGLLHGCLLGIVLLIVSLLVIFVGVPYAIEVMRETQRERNNEPPRFPVR